jgi:hypothetical protein
MERPIFNIEDKRVAKWLGIRNLQLEVLYSTYCLELEEEETSFNNIRIKFNILFNRDIARQNVFSQVNALIARGYVERKGKKELKINFEAITSALKEKNREYGEEGEQINEFAANIQKQFRRITNKNPKPEIQYRGMTECLDILAEHIPYMKNVYIISPRFPNIAYNEEISKSLKRKKYHQALRNHLKKKGNRLFYLTALNLGTSYSRALQVTKNPTKAYMETCKMMDELCELEATLPGLKIRYWEHAYGTHIFILENPTHGEVVMTIMDHTISDEIMTKPLNKDFPAVHIKSKEISDKAKETFLAYWEQGIDINSKKAQPIIQNIEQELYSRVA